MVLFTMAVTQTSTTQCLSGRLSLIHIFLPGTADSLLEPDDVTFSILVRGYGETEPPQWLAISGLLSKMQSRFNLKPSTGETVDDSHMMNRGPNLLHFP